MKNAKEMVWKDKDLEARYRRNLEAMEERHRRHPKLASPWALPYKVFTENSMHGIQNMRIRWLIANRPQEYREMMMANVLEQHLRETERRTRHQYGRNMDMLHGAEAPQTPYGRDGRAPGDHRDGPLLRHDPGAARRDGHGDPRDRGKLLNRRKRYGGNDEWKTIHGFRRARLLEARLPIINRTLFDADGCR